MTRLQNGQQKPQLRVRIEPEQMAYLQVEAASEKKTLSEIARELLAKAISYRKAAKARAR